MEELLEYIKNNLWFGKPIVVQYNKAMDIKELLYSKIKEKILSQNNFLFIEIKDELSKKDIVIDDLLSYMSMVGDNKAIILIHNLFYYRNPEAIINMFYGKSNISVITTSTINIDFALGNKATQVSGRYINCFLSPELYTINQPKNEKYHLDCLEGSIYEKDGKELYTYIINHSGEVLSFRDIYQGVSNKRSLPYCVKLVNYMISIGMLYVLNRVEVQNGNTLSSGFVFYPTYVSDIDNTYLNPEKKYERKMEGYLIAKLFSQNYDVARAIGYHGEYIDGVYKTRVIFNRGFLVSSPKAKYLIKIAFDDDMVSSFIKSKSNYLRVVALLGSMEWKSDSNGVIYCGLENLLLEGIKNNG